MSTPFAFTRKTFNYFDGAKKNAMDREWFEAHRALYEEHVELPLTHLAMRMKDTLAPTMPGIVFSARKIQKPLLRRMQGEEGPVVRTNASMFFTEPPTSRFEYNPGFYVSVGAGADDNVIGCGIYMPSSRQMKALRAGFVVDHLTVDAIFAARDMKKHWSGLGGERYKRFPKDYDEHGPGAQYLWHKQLLLSKHLDRAAVLEEDFIENAVRAFQAAAPFISWMRRTVGVYKPPAAG